MLRRLVPGAAALTVGLMAALPLAKAEPLAPSSVPANAKWLVHVDMDAARSTKLWELVQDKFIAPQQKSFDQKIAAVETITGMKFPRDLHDFTVYSPSFAADDVCIVVHATVNQATITDLLKMDADFRSTPHNDHDVLTWRDKDKDRLMYGAFFGQDKVIVSPSQKLVEGELDVLDNKAEGLKAASPLAGPPVPEIASAVAAVKAVNPVLYIAGQGLADLKKAQDPASPFMAQTQAAWISVAEIDQKIVTKVSVQAKTDQAAAQLQSLADGMKAMLSLAATADNAEEKVKAASAALETLAIKRSGAVLSAELPISVDALKALIETNHIGEAPAKPAAKPAPANMP